MTSLDLRQAFNALSDVVVNRPVPLRKFDQIYMKISDMLLQAEHLTRWLDGKSVAFLGDGDAIGLALIHLKAAGVLQRGPKQVHVLDFDERIVNSINKFATTYGLEGKISAELYNVADPLPETHIGKYGAFYTNPPFGASNDGRSMEAFIKRGDEALTQSGTACIVAADDPSQPWTRLVMKRIQRYLLSNGFVIAEMLPEFHHYHLDDSPSLTSCSLIAVRSGAKWVKSTSTPLPKADYEQFYGGDKSLNVKYVRDRLQGGNLDSTDYSTEIFERGCGNE